MLAHRVCLIVAISALSLVGMAQEICPVPNEKDFYYEECFDPSVPVPFTVVEKILSTVEAKEDFDSLNADQRRHIERYFKARVINLGLVGERDLIVMGEPPMTGGDNSWFWIVRETTQGPMVLTWVGGNSVSVLRKKTRGLRDIEGDWCSAAFCRTERYRFDGVKYALAWSKTREQKPAK